MTTLSEVRELLYSAVIDSLSAQSINFENEGAVLVEGVPNVRYRLLHVGREQATLSPVGSRRYDSHWVFFARILVPVDTGVSGCDAIAQAIKSLFEGETFGDDVVFGDGGDPLDVGASGAWHEATVRIPFRYEETK